MMRNSYCYTKYFYNLKEILQFTFSDESLGSLTGDWLIAQNKWTALLNAKASVFGVGVGESINDYFAQLFETTSPYQIKKPIVDLLNFIFSRHKNDYILTSDKDEFEDSPSSEFTSQIDDFYNHLFSKINYSAPYYLKMLELYASNESKLMDNLTNELEGYVKQSDTPQNIDSTLAPLDSDKHVSSISQNKSKSTFATKDIMEKLNAVRDGYRNLIKNWASEFDGMFIEESNV